MRARPSLEPIKMTPPPTEDEEGTSAGRMLAWVTGAVALAAVTALLAVGIVPLPFGGKTEGDANATSLGSRIVADRRAAPPPVVAVPASPVPAPVAAVSEDQAALVARFAALRQHGPQEQQQPSAIVPQAVKVERVVMPQAAPPRTAPPPNARAIDREEVTALYERGRALMEQGDIASARLMLARAAEAGDARSALALGSTYDPDELKRLGVIGVSPDPAQAHGWYTRAVALGSAEASLQLERLAQVAPR
jgi:hypothetical protein